MSEKEIPRVIECQYSANIMPGVSFPVKTTIVEFEDCILVISPGPIEVIKDKIPNHKPIHVVAPNTLHYLHLGAFYNSFPEAKFYGPENLEKKLKNFNAPLNPIESLKKLASIKTIKIEGNDFLSETLIYLEELKILIATDLCFHMTEPMPLGRKLLLKAVGAYNKPAQSRLVKITTKNKEAYKKSLEPLKGLEINKVIVGHGRPVEGKVLIDQLLDAIGQ